MDYSNLRAIKYLDKPNTQVDKYIQSKSLDDVPENVKKDIKLISLSYQDEGIPFGSYMNRVADYFGDVDVIQLVDKFNSKEDVGPKTAEAIQMVIKRIIKSPNRWFSEFKAGIDKIYLFDIGYLEGGVYYISDILPVYSELLYESGMLNSKEIGTIRRITKKYQGDGNDYDEIFNLFRSYYVLRWTEDEIIKGEKELPGDRIYSLEDAVTDRSAVKIDMIIYENNKFMEVTNFMVIGYEENGKYIPVNIDPKLITPEFLPIEVEKLYYSDYYYKPFKLVKRAFAYLKWFKKNRSEKDLVLRGLNTSNLDKSIIHYVHVLKKTINILYTINSEIEAMMLVIDKVDKKKILKRLNNIKEPLSNVLEINNEMLELLVEYIDDNEIGLDEKLEKLHNIFKDIINFWTIIYFEEEGINPPPEIVLPEVMNYNPGIIRSPDYGIK